MSHLLGHLCSVPLDVLRACVAFWPLEQRLASERLSRRWHAALQDLQLWHSVEIPISSHKLLSSLLARHGHQIRVLTVWGGTGCALPVSLHGLGLSVCTCLLRLTLIGFWAKDLLKAWYPKAPLLPSVRELKISTSPYFVMNSFSHHTGTIVATSSLELLVRTFPNLEELWCDYLSLRRKPDDPDDAFVETVGTTCPSLRRLSLVSIVHDSCSQSPQWDSPHCRVDLAAIAAALPSLESLELRTPKLSTGRVTLRPGRGIEDVIATCHRFCALDASRLCDAWFMLPKLNHLSVESLCGASSDTDIQRLFSGRTPALYSKDVATEEFSELHVRVASTEEARFRSLAEAYSGQSIKILVVPHVEKSRRLPSSQELQRSWLEMLAHFNDSSAETSETEEEEGENLAEESVRSRELAIDEQTDAQPPSVTRIEESVGSTEFSIDEQAHADSTSVAQGEETVGSKEIAIDEQADSVPPSVTRERSEDRGDAGSERRVCRRLSRD